jgi:hypothetical protein
MKGTILDFLVIGIALLLMSISILFGSTMLREYATMFNATNPPNTSMEIIQSGQTTMRAFDSLFVLLTFGMMLATVISAFFVRTHPVFFVLSLLLMLLVLPMMAIFSNIFEEFATHQDLLQAASDYPLMQSIWGSLPTITLVFIIVTAIVLYSKMNESSDIRGGGNEGYY